MKKALLIVIIGAIFSQGLFAQDFSSTQSSIHREFEHKKAQIHQKYNETRLRINLHYAEMLERIWRNYNGEAGPPSPIEERRQDPIVFPDDDKGHKDHELQVEVVPQPEPDPQPEPTVPIEEEDKQPKPEDRTVPINYFGTELQVRVPDGFNIDLKSPASERAVAKAWKQLSESGLEITIGDCLELRTQRRLCDWAYLLFLRQVADGLCGGRSDLKELLSAYLYSQSGYKMRMAFHGDKRLIMLYSSKHQIYNKRYWNTGGEKWYPVEDIEGQLQISSASFPGETSLSLQVYKAPILSDATMGVRSLNSKRYDGMQFAILTNRNLINFYDTYPTSMIGDDFGTRWAMYANTEMSETVQESFYPSLRRQLVGKSEFEQVSRVLNLLQTGLEYKYDDQVWGHDRAFFAEETLFYPYADCEDRAILFSRIVRDVIDLPVVLLYYPGHLAAAVNFNENITGDYVQLSGRRYVVCDPTYVGAPVGATMPGMENSQAKLIPVGKQ